MWFGTAEKFSPRRGLPRLSFWQGSFLKQVNNPYRRALLRFEMAVCLSSRLSVTPTSLASQRRQIMIQMEERKMLRTLIGSLFAAAVLITGLSATALAQESRPCRFGPGNCGELRSDRREIRSDKRELRGDRREFRQDRREIRSDVREYRQDRRQGASREELWADRHEIIGDRREVRGDRREYRGDRRDLRGDVRDFRHDRRDARH